MVYGRVMIRLFLFSLLSVLLTQPGWADVPVDGALDFQPAVTPVFEKIHSFHSMVLPIIVVIAAFVLLLLIWVAVRYNAKANPKPSKTSHNTVLEIIWTAIPVVILIAIGVPSMKLLYYSDKAVNADFTLKAVGHQWYWSYEYPDHGDIAFDSYMVPEKDLKKGQLRNLEVDNRVVVPVGKAIRVLVTAEDVIHSWGVPAFGVKKDAVPGKLNETWFRVDKEGTYYGMCYEICGPNHAFMPIAVQAVSEKAFAAWVVEKGGKMPAAKKTSSLSPQALPLQLSLAKPQ
jgi:cytochrome c oxidase subunit II